VVSVEKRWASLDVTDLPHPKCAWYEIGCEEKSLEYEIHRSRPFTDKELESAQLIPIVAREDKCFDHKKGIPSTVNCLIRTTDFLEGKLLLTTKNGQNQLIEVQIPYPRQSYEYRKGWGYATLFLLTPITVALDLVSLGIVSIFAFQLIQPFYSLISCHTLHEVFQQILQIQYMLYIIS